jgi:transcriptional regulator with XRE-family HTH domain
VILKKIVQKQLNLIFMKNRIKEFMTLKSINAAELADKIGVQRSNISHILSGRNLPSVHFIEKLVNSFPELNLEWLLTGNGNIWKTAENKRENAEYEPKIDFKHDTRQQEKSSKKEILLLTEPQKKIEKVLLFYSDKSFREYFPE